MFTVHKPKLKPTNAADLSTFFDFFDIESQV